MISTFFRHSLMRELAVILSIKVLLIVIAALFLFNSRQRPPIDAAAVAQHLLGHIPPQR